MVYDVNVTPISPKLGTQILNFLSEFKEGNDNFECTRSMVELIAENIKSGISILNTLEKVDLGIALTPFFRLTYFLCRIAVRV